VEAAPTVDQLDQVRRSIMDQPQLSLQAKALLGDMWMVVAGQRE
jgi:hypothetical protein